MLTSCEDGVCRLWSETLLPEDSLLGGQISENTHSFSSTLPGLTGNKDKIQHALEVGAGTDCTLTKTPSDKALVLILLLSLVCSVHPPLEAFTPWTTTILRPGGAQRAAAHSAGHAGRAHEPQHRPPR